MKIKAEHKYEIEILNSDELVISINDMFDFIEWVKNLPKKLGLGIHTETYKDELIVKIKILG